MAGVNPILRPGEEKANDIAYDKTLEKALQTQEHAMAARMIREDPQSIIDAIKAGDFRHQTEEQLTTLWKSAHAESGRSVSMQRLQKSQQLNKQSQIISDAYSKGQELPVLEDMDPDVRAIYDVLLDKQAAGTTNTTGELDPLYYDLRGKLELGAGATPILSEHQLLEAYSVLPIDAVEELREISDKNTRLLPKMKEIRPAMTNINAQFSKLQHAASLRFEDSPESRKVVLRELEDERELLMEDTKDWFIQGDSRSDVNEKLKAVFEATDEGILKGFWSRMRSRASFGNTTKDAVRIRFEKGIVDPKAADPERVRVRAMINLLMTEDYDREVEAMIEAGWFIE
jgi:hypothetical protein